LRKEKRRGGGTKLKITSFCNTLRKEKRRGGTKLNITKYIINSGKGVNKDILQGNLSNLSKNF